MTLAKKSWKDVQDTSMLITFSIDGHSKLVFQGYTEQGHIIPIQMSDSGSKRPGPIVYCPVGPARCARQGTLTWR